MTLLKTLSARELTVLNLSAWGYANKEIAAQLNIAVKTVEAHKFNGMRKLRITDRAQLVRHAVREGWFNLDDSNATSAPDNAPDPTAGDQSAGA